MLTTKQRRAMKAKKKATKEYKFLVYWEDYTEPDHWEDPQSFVGWYVVAEFFNHDTYNIGPTPGEDDGYPTADAALAAVEKWAEDRGIPYSPPPILFTLKQELE